MKERKKKRKEFFPRSIPRVWRGHVPRADSWEMLARPLTFLP